MHLDPLQQHVHGGGTAEFHRVGVGHILDLAERLDDQRLPVGGDGVAYDEQVVDMRVQFDTEVVLVFERHEIVGVSVFAGVVVEKGVRQDVVQDNLF